MGAPKGNNFNPKGRGHVPGKTTKEIREAYQFFVTGHLAEFDEWLKKMSEKDRFDVIIKMSEYFIPKLARVEQELGPETKRMIITWANGNRNPLPAETTPGNLPQEYKALEPHRDSPSIR